MAKKILSKSSYLAGLQCPKLLWIKINDKKRVPGPKETTKVRFKKGYEIEDLAKSAFKKIINIPTDNFTQGLKQTNKYLNEREIISEASFLINRLYARADVLAPNEDGSWNIFEIKSATRVKETNLHDLSFQKHVYKLAGLSIKDIFLVHINKDYVYDGITLNVQELFKHANVTEEVKKISEGIEERIEKMFEVIDIDEPFQEIGAHCNSPYECDMKYECWSHIPKSSVFDLHNIQKKCFELYAKGTIELKDIPIDFDISSKQLIQKITHIEQEHHMNKKGLQEFLDSLTYPLHFLDFETTSPGIPKHKGMKPYQRLPFQYSLHIQEEKGGPLKHRSFLHRSKDDPRGAFLESLKQNITEQGSILVFNKSFEKSILEESVEEFQEFAEWLEKIKRRLIDLIVPFRNFDYYHPNQHGSTSIKNVINAFSEKAYENLNIQSGDIANLRYEEAIYNEELTHEEKQNIFKDLEEYCKQDTLAEATIIEGLINLTKQ